MARTHGRPELFEVARTVEVAATGALAPRGVYINVNFYGALLFHLLGADPPLVPCLVAIGRMAGTAALVREALDGIRLYRPLSRYVGPGRAPPLERGRTVIGSSPILAGRATGGDSRAWWPATPRSATSTAARAAALPRLSDRGPGRPGQLRGDGLPDPLR